MPVVWAERDSLREVRADDQGMNTAAGAGVPDRYGIASGSRSQTPTVGAERNGKNHRPSIRHLADYGATAYIPKSNRAVVTASRGQYSRIGAKRDREHVREMAGKNPDALATLDVPQADGAIRA